MTQWSVSSLSQNLSGYQRGLSAPVPKLVSCINVLQTFYLRLSGVQLDPCKAWCPVLECQAVCSVSPGAEGKPVPILCPTCHGVFCYTCKELWEDGHSCQQHQPLVVLPANDRLLSPVCFIIERIALLDYLNVFYHSAFFLLTLDLD